MERRPSQPDSVPGKPGFSPTPEDLAKASEALGLETPVTSLDELMAHIYAQEIPDGLEPVVLRPLGTAELAWLTLWIKKL